MTRTGVLWGVVNVDRVRGLTILLANLEVPETFFFFFAYASWLWISETKKRNKLTCPHCGKVGGVSNMRRYHFDNCKHKP